MMKFRIFALLPFLCLSFGASAQNQSVKDVAPTGTLRVAIGVGPAASAFYCIKDPKTGKPRGVAVNLGAELGRLLHVPVEYIEYPSSGAITEAADKGAWDVAFMPVDPERAKTVDFGPAYYLFESTYLVPANSKAKSVADVDKPGARIIGVANTTTGRAAAASLKQATFTAFGSVPELMDQMREGKADAVALSRESLTNFSRQFPGSRILPGGFWRTGVAVAVPKGRKQRLTFVSVFVENAKATGSVRRALDEAGLLSAAVAPREKKRK
jgi:polar amino acid transport system substrate-binding protein